MYDTHRKTKKNIIHMLHVVILRCVGKSDLIRPLPSYRPTGRQTIFGMDHRIHHPGAPWAAAARGGDWLAVSIPPRGWTRGVGRRISSWEFEGRKACQRVRLKTLSHRKQG